MSNIELAFLLTLLAGLSTGIGSAIALLASKTKTGFLSFSLGLSAGVMIYVSFIEILPKSNEFMISNYGDFFGKLYAILSFFGGILLIGLIDSIIPSDKNPHEARQVEDMNLNSSERKTMMRIGILSAIAITIHNFPEGLATFVSAITDPSMGISVAVAVAIHNIPEGIAVSIPIYFATQSKTKAFAYSFLSGLSETMGAILGFILIQYFFPNQIMGVIFGVVAGIMVYISIDELLPAAQKYGKHHTSIFGLITGMAIMAISLLFLE